MEVFESVKLALLVWAVGSIVAMGVACLIALLYKLIKLTEKSAS